MIKPLPPPKDPLARWNLLSLADLAAPLPPIPWVCEAIGMAPGAVSLVAGYGYSRKTMAMQSLGLSVAAGLRAWGVWTVRKGAFVHLDYEQGRRLTPERYQRLALGMGFPLGELEPKAIKVACMPHVYLDEQGIYEELIRVVDGAAFVLVDSLRAAFPGADENSSEVRTYLDVLTRVSERTGAAIAVIHHARKPNAMAGGTATHSIRGSSALFDACQSVYIFEGEKDTPTRVHHQKDRVRGVTLESFGLTSEDVPGPSGPRHGLIVRHLEAEQIAEDAASRVDAKEEAAVQRVADAIFEVVRAESGGVRGSRKDVRSMVRASVQAGTQTFDAAWMRLVNGKRLFRSGTTHAAVWTTYEVSAPGPRSVPDRSPDSEGSVPGPPVLKTGDRYPEQKDHDRSPELLTADNLFSDFTSTDDHT